MSILKYIFSLSAITSLFLLVSLAPARAVPASGNMNADSIVSDFILVDGAVNIIETVEYDRNAGPWLKRLIVDPQQDPVTPPLDLIILHEEITIGGSHAWTDWHEEILTPGWEWGPIVFDILNANDQSILNNLVVDTMGNMAWFFFDKVPPGSTLQIWKEIICTSICDPLQSAGFVEIIEYPTVSEPGTLALMGLFLATFSLYRRRARL